VRELEELRHRAQVRDDHQALATATAQQEPMEEEGEEDSEHGEEGRPRAPPPEMGARDQEKWWIAERKREARRWAAELLESSEVFRSAPYSTASSIVKSVRWPYSTAVWIERCCAIKNTTRRCAAARRRFGAHPFVARGLPARRRCSCAWRTRRGRGRSYTWTPERPSRS
jgi:hypothetical protein